jgi:D-3-phosphoglycerate dehydrogenase
MMKGKVLASTTTFGQVGKEPVDMVLNAGYELIKNTYGRTLKEDEVITLAGDCVGIVAGLEPLTAKVMDACTKLKCISRIGVGMDNVDLEYAKARNIKVVNTPFGPTQAVAELTLGLTLSLLRKVPKMHKNLTNGIWKKETGNLLKGKTIGIIGMGKIGKAAATMFKALDNEVIGYDLYPDNDWANEHFVQMMGLDELMQTADIITIHLPASKDKKAVIGARELNMLKPGSFIVNVSRGGVVNEEALLEALSQGPLKGAAIDVFGVEPYDGPLTKLDNVVVTPHVGSYAAEGKLQMEIDAVHNLLEALKEQA